MLDHPPRIAILGTRGVPAAHGGFETFCERLALYLVKKGWDVSVYNQVETLRNPRLTEDVWHGIRRIIVEVRGNDSLSTLKFDWVSTLHAAKNQTPVLLLGYNTAIFSLWLRICGVPIAINMDGIEWRRAKWNRLQRTWLLLNELAGARLGNILIADHPDIEQHLSKRRQRTAITMIPYGADRVDQAAIQPILKMGLRPDGYFLAIGRIEPENQVLELVRAFSRSERAHQMVCLGKFEPGKIPYHATIMSHASKDVIFPGAIYDQSIVQALRKHARAYCHGHTVGGTNPSLVEALGAGNAVIAHANNYNRWVAGKGQFYFDDVDTCARIFDMLSTNDEILNNARTSAQRRHNEAFLWNNVLESYENILLKMNK